MAKIPVLIINAKTYEQATGANAVALAKAAKAVADDLNVNIMLALQAPDLYRVSQVVSLPLLSQHLDPITYGANTGYLLPEAIKAAGACGTLLNHSEHRMRIDLLANAIKRAKESGLLTVVCANDIEQGIAVAQFCPDFIAIEPPELIGGKISVSTAKPELIRESVEKINAMIVGGSIHHYNRVIVGAGVKNSEDVRTALELGAVGVLVASGVTLATDQKKAIYELALGMKK